MNTELTAVGSVPSEVQVGEFAPGISPMGIGAAAACEAWATSMNGILAPAVEAPSEPFVAPSLWQPTPEITKLLGQRGFIREAPALADMKKERDRTNLVQSKVVTTFPLHRELIRETTEQRGLKSLSRFLGRMAIYNDKNQFGKTADSMREHLTFIGHKEYQEAVAGIAAYWQEWLDRDPRHQLCAVAAISDLDRPPKSDRYFLEQVLESFAPEKLEDYRARLIVRPEDITAKPQFTKIVMVDDWTVSGSQMITASGAVHDKAKRMSKKYVPTMEINLITAGGYPISNGIELGAKDAVIPVKAYFMAHHAPQATHSVHISGTHSSVDYGFQNSIDTMMSSSNCTRSVTDRLCSPLLAHVVKQYKDTEQPLLAKLEDIAWHRGEI